MKVLLLSHGMFAKELVNSCMFINQGVSEIESICLDEEGIDKFANTLNEYLIKNKNESILFLCDLKHGSPYNQLRINLLTNKVHECRIVSGMNLPMLLQVVIMKENNEELSDVAKQAHYAGVEGVSFDDTEK